MDVIFLLGATQAFFLAFLAFNKKGKSTADYILAFWLCFMGLHLLDHYSYSTGIAYQYPHILGIGVSFPLLQGPLMFLYIQLMITRNNKFKWSYLLHAIPFLFFTVYFLFDFYFLTTEGKLAYYAREETDPSIAVNFLSFLSTMLGPIYVIWSLIKLRKHIKNISNRFSYTEEIDLKWLKHVLIGLGFVWLTVMFSNFFGLVFPILDGDLSGHLIYLSLTIAIFFLGYFGIRQQAIYVNLSTAAEPPIIDIVKVEEKKEAQYKKSGLKDEEAKKHLQELIAYMDGEKPYLNGKLSLKEVAAHIDISVNHLSQIINEQLSKSFFDFVNEYRVAEVKKQIEEMKHEQFTLLSIAYNSGFNSKSSFNSIFKKLTGLTPSQYIFNK